MKRKRSIFYKMSNGTYPDLSYTWRQVESDPFVMGSSREVDADMIIGVPKEIKNNEFRVGMTPSSVLSYKNAGHEVRIETLAGHSIGFTDEDYAAAGATIVATAAEVWSADMVVKVKEPLPEEYGYFHEGLILYTYLHLAPEAELTHALVSNKVTAIAYETIQLDNGSFRC